MNAVWALLFGAGVAVLSGWLVVGALALAVEAWRGRQR